MTPLQQAGDLPSSPQIEETLSEISNAVLSKSPDPQKTIDINALARKVYALLMQEARIERERRGRSIHW